MVRLLIITFFISVGNGFLLSQNISSKNNLLSAAKENYKSFDENPENSFQSANEIIREAEKFNLEEPELYAIATQCKYYEINKDFEKMISTAQHLYDKAEKFDRPVFQNIARIFLFCAYLFTDLQDEALEELKKADMSISKLTDTDSLTIATRANIYTCYSNYYSINKDFEKRLKYTKLAIQENRKMPNPEHRKKLEYEGYVNLATAYFNILNLDSSEYFAQKALSKPEFLNQEKLFLNYLTLARVAHHRKNYQEAINYLKIAEKTPGNKNHINLSVYYRQIIETYRELGDEKNRLLYERKRDSLKLLIFENQNKSLHKVIVEKNTTNQSNYIYLFSFLIIVLAGSTFWFVRKNRLLAKQEKISRKYLDRMSEAPDKEIYDNLLEMLKKNDSTFMFYFNEVVPDFSSKLLTINPELSQSEIEFCSMLKMKIPTKDIAKYKFIAPKTVQNKKHIIRKKLDIPKETDIYEWFDSI